MYVTGDLDYGSVLLGMLVMQDVQLGLFIAVMPTLIQAQSGDVDRSELVFFDVFYVFSALKIHRALYICCSIYLPQLSVWRSASAVSLGPGPAVSGSCAAGVFVTQIIPDWSLLQEASHREQRQQGNPGARDGSFRLLHADGVLFAFVDLFLNEELISCFYRCSLMEFYLTCCDKTFFVGNRVYGCFYGAGLFLGWSFAVLTGSHGHSGGPGMHRANQRFPRHHILCFYWSDRT